jgi:hypothetical protein
MSLAWGRSIDEPHRQRVWFRTSAVVQIRDRDLIDVGGASFVFFENRTLMEQQRVAYITNSVPIFLDLTCVRSFMVRHGVDNGNNGLGGDLITWTKRCGCNPFPTTDFDETWASE